MRMRITEDPRLVQARALCKTSDEAWELAADFFGLPMPAAMDVDGNAVNGAAEPITAERRLAVIEAAVDKLMTGDILRDELAAGEKRLADARNDQIRLRKERAEARTAEAEAEPSVQDEPDEHDEWEAKRREAEYAYDEAIARNCASDLPSPSLTAQSACSASRSIVSRRPASTCSGTPSTRRRRR